MASAERIKDKTVPHSELIPVARCALGFRRRTFHRNELIVAAELDKQRARADERTAFADSQ
ncbi:MAG: hypothetical protein AMXMBFR4_30890 [Candidatus Hydrogenedentota bacterium]